MRDSGEAHGARGASMRCRFCGRSPRDVMRDVPSVGPPSILANADIEPCGYNERHVFVHEEHPAYPVRCPKCGGPMPADEAPFPCVKCWDDDPTQRNLRAQRQMARAKAIRMAYDNKTPIEEIMRRFQCSRRQVFRILQSYTASPSAYVRAHPRG